MEPPQAPLAVLGPHFENHCISPLAEAAIQGTAPPSPGADQCLAQRHFDSEAGPRTFPVFQHGRSTVPPPVPTALSSPTCASSFRVEMT